MTNTPDNQYWSRTEQLIVALFVLFMLFCAVRSPGRSGQSGGKDSRPLLQAVHVMAVGCQPCHQLLEKLKEHGAEFERIEVHYQNVDFYPTCDYLASYGPTSDNGLKVHAKNYRLPADRCVKLYVYRNDSDR